MEEERHEGPIPLYEFEPSPPAVLDALLPWYVENRIYHALLESAAAEIAARRRAMKSATDNANDLLEQFSREFLQLYPQAKVLVTQRDDLQADRRRQFVARFLCGSRDAGLSVQGCRHLVCHPADARVVVGLRIPSSRPR